MDLLLVAAVVFLLNIPFGYWRANTKKFSFKWFLAVHLPVPIIITIRILSGLGWHLKTFPVMVGTFFLGQLVGGYVNNWFSKNEKVQISSCLVVDLYKYLNALIINK